MSRKTFLTTRIIIPFPEHPEIIQTLVYVAHLHSPEQFSLIHVNSNNLKYIFLIVSALVSATAINAQTCNFRIAGHVTDEHIKSQLQGASVILLGTDREIMTNSAGNFVFENLCPGSYRIQVSHINCETVYRDIVLEKNVHVDILLPHAENTLEEVTISAYRNIPNAAFNQELTGKELEATRGSSLAEALDRLSGVTTLKTGSNVAKPVIHGLHGNRLLIINNGIRQEGQQWGNEHAPEVDPFIAGKLSVIKGVDELKYGSDAIGGVVLVEARPLRHLPGWTSEINSGYSTNGRAYYGSAWFEHQPGKSPFSYRLQGTYKRSANIQTPGYTLNNSGLKEYNFSGTAGWKKENYSIEAYLSYFNTVAGIFPGAHIGNLTDLETAIAAPKPDDIYLGEKTYTIERPKQEVGHLLGRVKTILEKNGHKFNLTLGFQQNRRQEFDRSRGNDNPKPQLDLLINTFSQDLSWDHKPAGNFRGTVGLSGMQQDNSFGGRYFIPNYQSFTGGAYWIEKFSVSNWELSSGLRYDMKKVGTQRLQYNGEEISHDFNFSTMAAVFNVQFKPNEHIRLNAGTGLSSRAPHVNELLSNGIHHGTATFEEGDITLGEERSLNTSLGIEGETSNRKFSFEVSFYNNSIRDFIYRKPMPDEPVLTIAGAFPKIKYAHTDAVLRGIDADIHWKLLPSLEYILQGSILRARDKVADDWLIYMPSDRISNQLVYSFKDGRRFGDSYLSAGVTHGFKQSRTPSEKNGKQDYKVAPDAYTLVELGASTEVLIGSTPLTIGLTVSNLLNTAYRDYINSFRYFTDEAGRNFAFRIKVPIVSNH